MTKKQLNTGQAVQAIKLLIAGAIFFVAITKQGIPEQITLAPWVLILIALWLTIDTLANNRR